MILLLISKRIIYKIKYIYFLLLFFYNKIPEYTIGFFYNKIPEYNIKKELKEKTKNTQPIFHCPWISVDSLIPLLHVLPCQSIPFIHFLVRKFLPHLGQLSHDVRIVGILIGFQQLFTDFFSLRVAEEHESQY